MIKDRTKILNSTQQGSKHFVYCKKLKLLLTISHSILIWLEKF